MNSKEKVWKKLAKKDLIISPRVQEILESDVVENQSIPQNEMLKDLQEKLDGEYTVIQLHTVVHPTTFEPIATIGLRRTKPYSKDKWAKRLEK